MKHGNSKLAAFADTAIDVIRTLVTDPNAPPSVRLRAAKLILDSTTDREDDDDGDDDNNKAKPGPRPTPAQQPIGPGPVVAQPSEPVRPLPKVGRNDYCPCGSGLKFKKCCLGKVNQPGRAVLTPFARPVSFARQGPPAAAA